MSTAKQLISAFVDAPPLYWDRSYVQNMREIRGYPNWWRIRDDVAYIDGPPNEGEQYTRDLYVWSVEIVKDEDTGANTNKLELYDLDNTLEESTSVINGETVYRWKYRAQEPELTYEHTDVIDSVSLEFDQLGRRMIAFESQGDVFLIWFDSQAGSTVVTNFGDGYTPYIVTDTYRRTGGAADSERLLFYVDSATKQIVYRRQDDRFGVIYNLPSAPSDVVELLKVSKNLYGGLTVLYCYDDGTGKLLTGSFTARSGVKVDHIGSDSFNKDKASADLTEVSLKDFVLKVSGVDVVVNNSASLIVSSVSSTDFVLRINETTVESENDTATLSISSVASTDFVLEVKETFVESETDTASVTLTSITNTDFVLKQTLIEVPSYGVEDAALSLVSTTNKSFFLGV